MTLAEAAQLAGGRAGPEPGRWGGDAWPSVLSARGLAAGPSHVLLRRCGPVSPTCLPNTTPCLSVGCFSDPVWNTVRALDCSKPFSEASSALCDMRQAPVH